MKKKPAEPSETTEEYVRRVTPPETITVSTVEILEQACREEIVCEFKFKEKTWKVTGRSLTPGERDRVDVILEQALPDLMAPADAGADFRYDLRNPEYLKAKHKFKAQARALALFLAYPMFAQYAPVKAATNPVKIEILTDVMQGLFNEEIHELLWSRAIGPSRLWDRVNFF